MAPRTKKKASRKGGAKAAAKPRARSGAKAKPRAKTRAKSRPGGKAQVSTTRPDRAAARADVPRVRPERGTEIPRPVRSARQAARRKSGGRERFAFSAIDAPSPQVEALLVRVYQQAAQELDEQEQRARRRSHPAAGDNADTYARARDSLIAALVRWEQRHGGAR